ncbi:MAG TPA: hypothetical protein VK821_02780 [Dehalococcoidia bacterium]|nr:hypothetical protein [Dehalococcoidia bacterium]
MVVKQAGSSQVADLALVKRRIGEVLQGVNRYWAGEAEIAATFFSQPHSADEHLYWLKSQMVRELGWPDGRLERTLQAYKAVERERDRHEVHALLQNAEEEYSHYVVLADIAESAAGRRVLPEEIMYNKDLAEWKALDKVRTREADWDNAVSGFHEGGGLGIYWTAMHLASMEDDPYREQIAAAMAMIYDDEIEHAARGFRSVVRVAATATEETWQRVVEKVNQIGYHRVRMRNEQFGFPISEDRIQEIHEGKITPYIPLLPEVESVYQEVAGV